MQNKRVCFVEVECIDDKGTKKLKRLNGLALKGTAKRQAGNTKSEATLQIANLDKRTVEYLTTYTTPYFNPKTKKKINIYAGYEQTGWGRIFSGDITEAIPKGMPDNWLHIKAQSLYYANRTTLTYTSNNISVKELGKSISGQLGLSFDWQATSQKNIDNFDFVGSKAELIKHYNQIGDVIMFEDNGILRVVDKKQKPPEKGIKFISKETGLIGEVEPDQYGIKLKCLIDASLDCGKWIKTKSEKLPNTNGLYCIYSLDFDFASREQQFYCNIYAKTSKV